MVTEVQSGAVYYADKRNHIGKLGNKEYLTLNTPNHACTHNRAVGHEDVALEVFIVKRYFEVLQPLLLLHTSSSKGHVGKVMNITKRV